VSTRYIGGAISLHSEPPSSSTYVCGHSGTILGLDTPCTEVRWPGFIDNGQGQALDSTCVHDLLHSVHKVGREDSGRRSAKSRSSLFTRGPTSRVKRNNDGEEGPE
jgi:hypothetical protein